MDLQNFDRLKKERVQLRRGFSRSLNALEDKFKLEIEKQEDLSSYFEKFLDKAERLFALDKQVSEIIYTQEVDEKILDAEYDEVENYREKNG